MMLHDTITIIVFALCAWAIISPHVPTGILATVGLCALAVAALWSLDINRDAGAVIDTMLGGVGLVGAGVAWRVVRRRSRHMRRLSDWGAAADWAPTQPPLEIDITQSSRIGGGGRP